MHLLQHKNTLLLQFFLFRSPIATKMEMRLVKNQTNMYKSFEFWHKWIEWNWIFILVKVKMSDQTNE